MSSYDPHQPGPEQQGGGPPSFDKPSPPADPHSAPPPLAGGPHDTQPPPAYGYGSVPEYGAPGGPIQGGPPLAGRGRRLLARIIDSILVGVVGTLVTVPFVDYNTVPGELVVTAVTQVLYWIYDSAMNTMRGQTVGKMATRIRVAMLADGSTPAARAAVIRGAVFTLPPIVYCIGSVFWLLNVLWCTWDKPFQQCIHDKAARTVVVAV